MTEWLVKTFIKDPDNLSDARVRAAYGTLSGLAGIFCNLVLFVVKFVTGIVSGSSAVLSDAINNLSDCLSCLITIAGARFAARPADEEHPFGHGRLEYVISLAVTAIIFAAAFELIRESVQKTLHPSRLYITPAMTVILVLTILVKLWMSRFNQDLGQKLHHTGLLAASRDSLNDVITTTVTIFSLFLSSRFPDLPIDGVTGVIVALIVFRSGYELARDIVGKLLGSEAEDEVTEAIYALIQSHPEVKGAHDLILHDYGPGNCLGSVHVELPGELSLFEAHAVIDACEKEAAERFGISLTIHPDPYDADEATMHVRTLVEQAMKTLDEAITIHDVQISEESGQRIIRFDARIPYGSRVTNQQVLEHVNAVIQNEDPKTHCRITFDRGYFSEVQE